jgi:hypothetical protein
MKIVHFQRLKDGILIVTVIVIEGIVMGRALGFLNKQILILLQENREEQI